MVATWWGHDLSGFQIPKAKILVGMYLQVLFVGFVH